MAKLMPVQVKLEAFSTPRKLTLVGLVRANDEPEKGEIAPCRTILPVEAVTEMLPPTRASLAKLELEN